MYGGEYPILIEPEDLSACLEDGDVLLVAVCTRKAFDSGHIPGSALIEPSELICGVKPAVGKLPDISMLEKLFSSIGLKQSSRVIVYDDEGGGWAGRLIWTLDALGHSNSALINGGFVAWQNEGFPVSVEQVDLPTTEFIAKLNNSIIADINDVSKSIDDEHTVVWDARAPEEYRGTKVTTLRNGHVPGAVNFDWVNLMDSDNNLKLRDLNEIKYELGQHGITEQVRVITHCLTHHRSGLTYFVGKLLGLDIRAYDGSWSEWGNLPSTPVE